jgi:hypothetical protein
MPYVFEARWFNISLGALKLISSVDVTVSVIIINSNACE